jgi:hypothetical protein
VVNANRHADTVEREREREISEVREGRGGGEERRRGQERIGERREGRGEERGGEEGRGGEVRRGEGGGEGRRGEGREEERGERRGEGRRGGEGRGGYTPIRTHCTRIISDASSHLFRSLITKQTGGVLLTDAGTCSEMMRIVR